MNTKHFPKNPNKFEFDEEVATIFPDMAKRSIPLYDEARKLSVKIAMHHIDRVVSAGHKAAVMDIGASTGAFYTDLWQEYAIPIDQNIPQVYAYAIDSSPSMVERIVKNVPKVVAIQGDACEVAAFTGLDIVVLSYVAQFIPIEKRKEFFQVVAGSMRPGALLIISEKEGVDIKFNDMFTDEYMRFRMENGYSMEEIEAKTRALRESMWPQSRQITNIQLVQSGFTDMVEISRWLQFSTSICYKRG